MGERLEKYLAKKVGEIDAETERLSGLKYRLSHEKNRFSHLISRTDISNGNKARGQEYHFSFVPQIRDDKNFNDTMKKIDELVDYHPIKSSFFFLINDQIWGRTLKKEMYDFISENPAKDIAWALRYHSIHENRGDPKTFEDVYTVDINALLA